MKTMKMLLGCLAVAGLTATNALAIPDYDALDLLLPQNLVIRPGNLVTGQFNLLNPGTDTTVFGAEYGVNGAGTVSDEAYVGPLPLPTLDVADIMFWIENEGQNVALTLAFAGTLNDLVILPLVAGGSIFSDNVFVSTSVLTIEADITVDGLLNVAVYGVSGSMTIEGAALGVSWARTATSVPDAGSTLAVLGLALLGVEGFRRKMAARQGAA